MKPFRPSLTLFVTLAVLPWILQAAPSLDEGFAKPPREARLRAYWWWLNGNVTKASITRDLGEMAAKGFGGALICDAGGAQQDGNDPVPHGPTFFSPEWRELYRHALREADRFGLEMSLNIQSGWNLGGPMVKPEQAPRKLVWSETRLTGPARIEQKLPEPRHPKEFYQDVAVVGYRVKATNPAATAVPTLTASSQQASHPATDATDAKPATFWVSDSNQPEAGPTAQRPQWLQFNFPSPIEVTGISVLGRPGYGPKDCELQSSDDGRQWRSMKAFVAQDNRETTTSTAPVRASHFRLVCTSAYDPRFPDTPRNVQIAEAALLGVGGVRLGGGAVRARLDDWEQKALLKPLHFSAPDTRNLLRDSPAVPGEESARSVEVIELTRHFAPDGTLRWSVPEGEWEILRFGCTLNDHSRVSTCSDGWQGYAIDPFDASAFRSYWDQVVEPLIADAGKLAGRTLKYLHTDSWEVEVANWTPTLRTEFRKRRGYDLIPFLPVIAGRIVDSRPVSNRFLNDLRRTMGDLAIDNHYRLFVAGAHRHGLSIHPESGGPHAVPIDSLQCLGMNDAPMSEFWAWSWRHRVGDSNRFFVKQPASAAHTYGRRLVLAEGFTTIGPHWQERPANNLKPSFDQALCEGLNLLVWHAFTCSPAEMGLPGQEYFAGTHFNPNSTWWPKSAAFLSYINRCQFLLQQGLFVADAVYYYGDHVPNFAQLKRSDPAGVLPGYDYDVATEQVILERMRVRDGRITLPDGMNYRVLVLPDRPNMSLPVLRKLRQLVRDGATVIGSRPEFASSLKDAAKADAEVARLAAELWADQSRGTAAPVTRSFGKGRIIPDRTAREVLLADGVAPDFEGILLAAGSEEQVSRLAARRTADRAPATEPHLDYIHRRADGTDIYFVANRSNVWLAVDCLFRVAGKAPELWDAVTGQKSQLTGTTEAGGRTRATLRFAPFGSWFVLFRSPASKPTATAESAPSFPTMTPAHEITGPWKVAFDPRWGGPAAADFTELVEWTTRPEPGIRGYSGTAIYRTRFDVPPGFLATPRLLLDLGDVREMAEVTLNGRSLGVLWSVPFRTDVSGLLRAVGNELEVEVVNFWPNRVISDQSLPPTERLTRTNIRKLTKDTPLMESGLLGPVRILRAEGMKSAP